MKLKTVDDWPIRELELDPFNVWTHWTKNNTLIPNENGVSAHFASGLQTFGVGDQHKLMRNSRNSF